MIRVSITKAGAVTNQAQFQTQAEADAWLAQEEANGSFGRQEIPAVPGVPEVPAVLAVAAVPEVLDADGNVVTAAIPAVEAVAAIPAIPEIPAVPAEFDVTQTDISAQLAEEARIAFGLRSQDLGARIIAKVYAVATQALASGAMSQAALAAMLSDNSLANVERLLWNGALDVALAAIGSSATLPTYFTPAQIADFESTIVNSGLLLSNLKQSAGA